jgi:hypothetical protein
VKKEMTSRHLVESAMGHTTTPGNLKTYSMGLPDTYCADETRSSITDDP